ncbi:MAG: serine hydrolase, partial [Solirubrobacterales bacterium]|nr:serine hydrolase [Solirubrobacterales bacterium]
MDLHLTAVWTTALRTRVPHASWLVAEEGRILTAHRPERRFASASIIKSFVLAWALDEVHLGRLALDEPVTVGEGLRADGDGVLRLARLPTVVPLRWLLELMVAVSDNTATNSVVARLGGVDVLNERLDSWGLRSRMRGYVSRAGTPASDREAISADPGLATEAGLGVTSCAEHDRVLCALYAGDIAGELGPAGIAMMLHQQDRRSLSRFMDDRARLAHKTGTVDRVRHDGGLLLAGDRVISVQAFTDGGLTAEWVDHPACVGMGMALAWTSELLGLEVGLVPDAPPIPDVLLAPLDSVSHTALSDALEGSPEAETEAEAEAAVWRAARDDPNG